MIYKFIAWADIHWDKLGAKCISLNDTDQVERAIFQRAKEGGFDFTLFAGDRYLKREPCDETKVTADRIIEDLVHPGGIPHYHLIGNHDYTDNTRRWHTAESMKRYNNCVVMDEAKTYRHKEVLIHSLPADFHFDKSKYAIDPGLFNLFVFHDAVRGCFLNDAHTQAYDSGLDLSSIDLPEFNLVLAGDIHVRQTLPFRNTQGGYLGSVLQRTKADSNIERGWTEYTIEKSSVSNSWSISSKFVPVRNYFTRVSFNIGQSTKAEDLAIPEKDLVDQLVEVRLTGSKVDVDRVADEPYWSTLSNRYRCRKIDVLRAYEAQQYEKVVDLSMSSSLTEDVEIYLDSGFASIGNLSRDRILGKVAELRGGKVDA